MDTNASPIAPCPFCGAAGTLSKERVHAHRIVCRRVMECGATSPLFVERHDELRDVRLDGDGSIISSSPDPEPAIARAVAWWNRRVSGAAAVATLPEPVGAPAVVGGGPALHGLQRVAR